ncbi:MAG: glutamine-synthetase adenylyltransferase, partial [Pyrinomonadaceae bacterium]
MPNDKIINLIEHLPDPKSAERFVGQFSERHPAQFRKLEKNDGLLSDVLTIAAYSPLLSTTLLQNPTYISWLETQRKSSKVRGKDEILESLARFALTNSTLDTNVLLARFRRRELLRIYLQDIRGLNTIAEITEEISILADAILEHVLQIARQEINNRFGTPQEIDKNGRAAQSGFCIVALGKLGSKELNYSSDIDLLFLYSNEGETSGKGAKDKVTNREYFVKLSEQVVKLVGAQTGEGAAYRVDMRLRPNGRVGALAIALDDAINYFKVTARDWEKQVLIRSRSCAGDAEIYQSFFENVKDFVFSKNVTVENALENVRLSKEKINLNKQAKNGFDVKLGKGGIREIEFIAQALQLAYGGRDEWLRAPHTLISLWRLADRGLLTETELTE